MTNHDPNKTHTDRDRLSTEQLEALLRADLDDPSPDQEAAIFHILEVIEQREKERPTGRLPDGDQAWAEFQQFYNIPEGEGQSLYPLPPEVQEEPETPVVARAHPRLRTFRKRMVAAAVLAALLMGMVTAQAAGVDLFGALGRWTEETFHFSLASGQTEQDAALKKAAETCQLPSELLPTWHPDGFEASEPQIDRIEGYLDSLSYLYVNGTDDLSYSIDLERYYDRSFFEALTFEKDGEPVREYQSRGRTFYIMSNLDALTATWSDGKLVETISGQLDMNEITKIIDSIGG